MIIKRYKKKNNLVLIIILFFVSICFFFSNNFIPNLKQSILILTKEPFLNKKSNLEEIFFVPKLFLNSLITKKKI